MDHLRNGFAEWIRKKEVGREGRREAGKRERGREEGGMKKMERCSTPEFL